MSIRLDYRLGEMSAELDRTTDLANADDMALRYDHFCGDLIFEVDDFDFSAEWEWVTILDAAAALVWVVDHLTADGREDFGFTESGALIIFERHGDTVDVRTTYTYVLAIATVTYAELRDATYGFLDRVTTELSQRFPGLAKNPFVIDLRRRHGLQPS